MARCSREINDGKIEGLNCGASKDNAFQRAGIRSSFGRHPVRMVPGKGKAAAEMFEVEPVFEFIDEGWSVCGAAGSGSAFLRSSIISVSSGPESSSSFSPYQPARNERQTPADFLFVFRMDF